MDRSILLLLTVLILLAALPHPVAAQQETETVDTYTQVRVADPGRALPPGKTTPVKVFITYRYAQGAVSQENTTVRLEVASAPSWAAVELNTTAVVFPVPTTSATSGASREVEATLNVTPSRGAVAFGEGNVTVRARAEANGNLRPSEGEGSQKLSPDFYSELTVRHGAVAHLSGGREHVIPIALGNLANGPTRVTVDVTAKPENALLDVPREVALGSAVTGGDSNATLELRIRTPWTASEEGTLEITLTPAHVQKPGERGQAQSVVVEIMGRSVVPGAGAPALLAAALAASFIARRGSLPRGGC